MITRVTLKRRRDQQLRSIATILSCLSKTDLMVRRVLKFQGLVPIAMKTLITGTSAVTT